MKKILFLLLIVLSLCVLVGCGEEDSTETNDSTNNPTVTLDLKFEDEYFVYDGTQKSIFVTNLPEGYKDEYIGNGVSKLGTHKVMAIVSDPNGKVVATLFANIIIVEKEEDIETKPSDEINFKFFNQRFIYDGTTKSIYVENLPEGYEVSYEGNGVSEKGTHKVVATITKDGTVVATLEAYINIVDQPDVELPIV